MLGESKSYFDRYTSLQTITDAQGRIVPAVEVGVTMWSDPLDFHQVSTVAEAVARVNAAGYFVLTANRDIYQVEPDGRIDLWRKWHFDFFFAKRRCGKRKLTAGTAWKRSDRRREYDSVGYWPENYGRPPRSYNLWQGWGKEPMPGDWSPIYDYILNVLAAGDIDRANYILDFCAHMVQRPWEKPRVALIFRGRDGTGKNLLIELLDATIGRRNVATTANDWRMYEKYNWNLADKLLIGAFSADKRELNKLKQLLIDEDIEVRQKYGHVIKIRSLHRIIITLDHRPVSDASDDGRLFVCEVSDKRRGDNAYFDPLFSAIDGRNDVLLAAFMHELRTRDIANWKPEEAARKVSSIAVARQNLLTLAPPLAWLIEQLDTATKDGLRGIIDLTPGTWSLRRERGEMLRSYRAWAKANRIQGSAAYTTPKKFHPALRRFLNRGTFPGARLEGRSGARYWWFMPTRKEMTEGLDRFLRGEVVEEHP